jgi:glyoxylase-like metal-dependent hydrolase (beta-lactamase superfamily II)
MVKPHSIRLGAFEIHRVIEMELPFLTVDEMFPAATREDIDAVLPRLQPWCVDEDRRVLVAVQSYLVRTPDELILLDTCIGCDKTNERFPFWAKRQDQVWLERLRATGHAPEDVTIVLCTHLHTDHAGWNTRKEDGLWVPTFPNAEYIFSKREVQHCMDAEPDLYRESVLPIIEAGHARLVDFGHHGPEEFSGIVGGDKHIAKGVWLEPTPGHTPGHVAVHLESEGRHAVMWGDLCHSPAQCFRPDWSYRRDWDGVQSSVSRTRVLRVCTEQGHLVLSSHFPPPSVGHIHEDDQGDGFRFEYAKD